MCNSRSASASAAGAAEEEGVGDDGESEADGESAEHGWKDCGRVTVEGVRWDRVAIGAVKRCN